MVYINEVFLAGDVWSPPTIVKLPAGTPMLWFMLRVVETWNNRAGRSCSRDNIVKVDILGDNVHQYADHIKSGSFCFLKGYLRIEESSFSVRVYRLVPIETFHEGYASALKTAMAVITENDRDKALFQLGIMREQCDPTKRLSAKNSLEDSMPSQESDSASSQTVSRSDSPTRSAATRGSTSRSR